MKNVDVVLISPENPGNVGAVARAMKNFGFMRLVLVNPCELAEARAQAKHAYDIIRNARILERFDANDYDYVIGTTGIVGSSRPCVAPAALKSMLLEGSVAILFGNEGKGLSRRELDACDTLVHIPTADAYAVMNLSHAVAIVLYELSSVVGEETRKNNRNREKVAPRRTRAELEKAFIKVLDNLDYPQEAAFTFRRVINRAPPSAQEASVLLGVLKQLNRKLSRGVRR